MELDDFRRSWQQSTLAEAPPAFDAAALTKLLVRGSRSPVARMRRNAWLEIGFAGVCLLLSVTALFYIREAQGRTLIGWCSCICLLSGFYFQRKLAVLRELSDTSGALREHVARQLASLRGLVRLYFRVTMWSVPVSLGIGLVFTGSQLVQHLTGSRLWTRLGLLGAAYLVAGGLAYFTISWFTRWYLQRLYGQHLDRLERYLAELDEHAA